MCLGVNHKMCYNIYASGWKIVVGFNYNSCSNELKIERCQPNLTGILGIDSQHWLMEFKCLCYFFVNSFRAGFILHLDLPKNKRK